MCTYVIIRRYHKFLLYAQLIHIKFKVRLGRSLLEAKVEEAKKAAENAGVRFVGLTSQESDKWKDELKAIVTKNYRLNFVSVLDYMGAYARNVHIEDSLRIFIIS